MGCEREIEDRIIGDLGAIGYAGADVIRRCRVGRRVGIVDLLLLPTSGPQKVVLIEVKCGSNLEGQAKVVGQLLLYYAGVLKIGTLGLELMRNFARLRREDALSEGMSSLKMLSGGKTPPDAAWAALQEGDRISRDQVHLFIGLDVPPSQQLCDTLSVVRQPGLQIGVVTAGVLHPVCVWSGAA
jgi:hypothetical protein